MTLSKLQEASSQPDVRLLEETMQVILIAYRGRPLSEQAEKRILELRKEVDVAIGRHLGMSVDEYWVKSVKDWEAIHA